MTMNKWKRVASVVRKQSNYLQMKCGNLRKKKRFSLHSPLNPHLKGNLKSCFQVWAWVGPRGFAFPLRNSLKNTVRTDIPLILFNQLNVTGACNPILEHAFIHTYMNLYVCNSKLLIKFHKYTIRTMGFTSIVYVICYLNNR